MRNQKHKKHKKDRGGNSSYIAIVHSTSKKKTLTTTKNWTFVALLVSKQVSKFTHIFFFLNCSEGSLLEPLCCMLLHCRALLLDLKYPFVFCVFFFFFFEKFDS